MSAPATFSFLPRVLADIPAGDAATWATGPDRRDGAVYVLDDDLRLAVDVALATDRPLLLRGEPGSGKSSLAGFLARNLGWRYYEHVVTARTLARDLLWAFDAVRKLADASARDTGGAAALRDADYVEPGVLWWAMDPGSARRRGADAEVATPAHDPDARLNADRDPAHAVVLVDEIDKADPDFPNGLLVPLGSEEFVVTETGTAVRAAGPARTEPGVAPAQLVIITTNEERELPPAFLRRCVVATLRPPDRDKLVAVARRHIALRGEDPVPGWPDVVERLAERFLELREQARQAGARPPSTAEYLDAVHACRRLKISLEDPLWRQVEGLLLRKDGLSDPRGTPA